MRYRVRPTSKYRNSKVQLDGYTFDSQAEAGRYLELKAASQAGIICCLQVHPSFELQPAFRDSRGEWHREIRYEADFFYQEIPPDGSIGTEVVEDTKGIHTEVFRIKEKLFLYKHGSHYDLRIVKV